MRRLAAVARAHRRRLMLLAAMAVALAAGAVGLVSGAFASVEGATLDARFAIRGDRPAAGVAVVGIDDRTFSELGVQWPFPRNLHAEVIDRLRADGARVVAYDVQFTEPSRSPRDDLALYDAVARARNVVLADTEVDRNGEVDVFGSEANVRAAHALVGMANLPADGDGAIRRYPRSILGHESFAVAAAAMAGRPVPAAGFDHDRALIDFRGGPGTIPTYSFVDVLRGRVRPGLLRGRVVVVGATSPTLQDEHATSTTTSKPMSGAEVQANAIWTALHDDPLAPVPRGVDVLAIVLCALVAPLAAIRLRTWLAVLAGLTAVGGYLVAAQLAFDGGVVLAVCAPVLAGLVATAATFASGYLDAYVERNAMRVQLHDSQLELLRRLAQAIDSRDAETGEHTERIGVLCRRLALGLGWPESEARQLMHAAVVHDVGKIGVSDRILLKSGPLDAGEWEEMKAHAEIGARMLSGSDSPLVQMAERIARSHHERWDGSGYPSGLSGSEIPIEGRICAVVDVYDALISRRIYKQAWRSGDVVAELRSGRGTHFDPAVLDAFLRLVPDLRVGEAGTRSSPDPAVRSASRRGETEGLAASSFIA